MIRRIKESVCCRKTVRVALDRYATAINPGGTNYYVCSKCNKACDAVDVLVKRTKAVSPAKIRPKKRVLKIVNPTKNKKGKTADLQKHRDLYDTKLEIKDLIYQKLSEFLDGILFDPESVIVLSPLKLRQFNEIQQLKQKLFTLEI